MSDQDLQPATLWTTTLLSLGVALVVLVTFVLPAEYGLDPTGIGGVLGIDGMSGYSVSALTEEEAGYQSDAVEFPLAPFESIEYKYLLNAGQAMVYSWSADDEVVFDLHSEEQGTDPDDAVSFSVGRAASANGTYVAPYGGVHGWFWENRGSGDVVVRLRTSGYYAESITYGPTGEFRRSF